MQDVFTLSHFLRRSGEVLDVAEEHDVVLTRRDGEDLTISIVPRADALRIGLELFAEVVLEATRDDEVRAVLGRALGSSARWTSGLTQNERECLLQEVAAASAESAGLGSASPLAPALDRWRRAARARASERPKSAHLTRPVAIPDDVGDPSIEKASGVVELPLRVRWSYPLRTYDLGDPRQLRRVYEQVLREGAEDDVRRFIDVDELVRQWDRLVLPRHVRLAWADWLRQRGSVDLSC